VFVKARATRIAGVPPIEITEAGDPRLSDYVGLRDADLRADLEGRERIFIVEGTNALRRLLATPLRTRSVLVTPKQHARLSGLLDGLDTPVYVASREVLAGVAGFDLHRGVVASADRPDDPGLDEVLARSSTVVALEALNDQENLGAIARSARALGADALVLDPTCADPYYRRVVRVSMGEVLHLPVTRLADWASGLRRIADAGFCLAALTPAGETSLFDWRPPERVALLLGAEGPGLSSEALAAADVRVRIPIRADVDSLNVGHAAAVALAFVSAARAGSPDRTAGG
jgi:tRNA G18 (ribose-2'-O)-methylase SpoU